VPLRSAIYTQSPEHRANAAGYDHPRGSRAHPLGPTELSRLERQWCHCLGHFAKGQAVGAGYLAGLANNADLDLPQITACQETQFLKEVKGCKRSGRGWRLTDKINTYQPNPVRGKLT